MFGVFDRRKNGICSAPSSVQGSRFPKENKREECKRHSRKPKSLKGNMEWILWVFKEINNFIIQSTPGDKWASRI